MDFMAGKSKAIGEELYNQCKLELKKYGIRGEIGRRLQAIISATVSQKLPRYIELREPH